MTTPAVQGIVNATIQPIQAKDLRLGPTQTFTDEEVEYVVSSDAELAAAALAADTVDAEQRALEASPEPITLHVPQFEQSPVDGDLSTLVCTGATHDRAAAVAQLLISFQEKMPITPLSADLLTLAYAYLSRHNAARKRFG